VREGAPLGDASAPGEASWDPTSDPATTSAATAIDQERCHPPFTFLVSAEPDPALSRAAVRLRSMSSVIVRGRAHEQVEPDHAVVDLALTEVAPTAAAALDAVAERSGRLAQLLERLGIDRADWVTSGAQVQEEHEWRDNTQVLLGHRATTSASITVRDLTAVAALLRAGVDEVAARIDRIAWQIAHDHPAHHRLLGAAATDARRRADAYASALELRVGAVEVISEAPIAADPMPRGGEMADTAMFRMAAAPGPGLELSSGRIDLEASVHVRFALV
jgi:uncharacterized protein